MDHGLKLILHAKFLPKLKFKREVQGWFITVMSDYKYFSIYHKRFGHKRVDLNLLYLQKRHNCTYLAAYLQKNTFCIYGAINV